MRFELLCHNCDKQPKRGQGHKIRRLIYDVKDEVGERDFTLGLHSQMKTEETRK